MFNCKAECSDLNNCKAESLLLSRMFRFDQLYSSSLSLLSCSLLQRVVRLLVSAAAGYCGLPRLRCLRAGRRWGRTVDSLSATGWSSSSCNIRYSRVRLPICVDEVMAAAWSWSKFSLVLCSGVIGELVEVCIGVSGCCAFSSWKLVASFAL
jgi:hypothetical protein